MRTGSIIKPQITKTAIEMFADRGYHGVSTRDIAAAAKVTEASIYRLFETKDGLFKEAISAALRRALDPAQFLLMIYENERKQEATALLTSAVLRWYSTLSRPSARLLAQAYFLTEWRGQAYGPIEKIIDILATHLGNIEKPRTNKAKEAKVAARASVLALLQFKMTYAGSCSPKEETEAVTAMVQQWFRGLRLT
ncbi:MAG TPA: helix-turn-helix domain-containing protein [Candidatus Angelobacter sp.]